MFNNSLGIMAQIINGIHQVFSSFNLFTAKLIFYNFDHKFLIKEHATKSVLLH